MWKFPFIIAFILSFIGETVGQDIWICENGTINFVSKAPLEYISADNSDLEGILNLESGDFAFKLSISDFIGFNNPIQRIHFLENYMEIKDYPRSTFSGFIIKDLISLSKDFQLFRTKGELKIHGVEQEIVVDVAIRKLGNTIDFNSDFEVLLEDFNISIPKIVRQKISETILIHVNGSFYSQ